MSIFDPEPLEVREARLDNEGGWTGTGSDGIPQLSAGIYGVVNQYPYIARSLPRHEGEPTDGRGHVVVQNRQHERELCAEHGYVRD